MGGKVVFLLFFITTVFVGQARSQEAFFRSDYTYDVRTKNFYKEGPKAKAWRFAVFDCEGEGAELAVPSSEVEMLSIVRYMSADTTSVWLGIHDAKANGEFKMLNGSSTAIAFDTSGPDTKSCVGMLRNGDYSAYDCNTLRKFVCVKDSKSVTSNTACETYDLEYFYSAVADRCYKIHIQGRIWNNARKVCILEGSSLVILNSPDEVEVVVNMLKFHETNTLPPGIKTEVIHLGYKDFMKTGEGFVTLDGKSLATAGFEVWAPGQPSATGPGVQCGGMLRNGNLTVVDCSQKAMFLCEKVLEASEYVPSLDRRFSIDD